MQCPTLCAINFFTHSKNKKMVRRSDIRNKIGHFDRLFVTQYNSFGTKASHWQNGR